MLPVYLKDDAMVVFWLSLVCMAITLTARVAECVRYYVSNMVKLDKLHQFFCASVLFVLEPNAGWVRVPVLVKRRTSPSALPTSRSSSPS